LVMEPKNIADHFKSIFNTSCPIVTPAYYVWPFICCSYIQQLS
jgi:hypothetical protein